MNQNDFKTACKALTLSLKEQGVTLAHSKILDIVAKTNGYKDYNTYVGMQSDFSRVKSFKDNKIIIDYNGDKEIGKQIVTMIMCAANDYYEKAGTFGNEKKLDMFPIPSVEYRPEQVIMTWKSGPGGFGPNTGIAFIMTISARSMMKKIRNYTSK